MKILALLLLTVNLSVPPLWTNNLDAAKQTAVKERKQILLNFSGSDWCVPCVRLHTTLFETEAFESFAAKNLVLVNADFPRMKKNQLPKEQVERNEALADQYNPEGRFPYTVLLDAKGRVLKTWEGCPDMTPEKFVEEINRSRNAPR